MQSKINNVVQKVDIKGRSGFIQYWELRPSVGNKRVLSVTGQPFRFNKNNQGLQNYRDMCLQYDLLMGPDTQVDQELFAGLAAQSRISDQRTLGARDQCMGQLVMPVFSNTGGDVLGVIEYVTTLPKESYVKDFNQICNLLKDESLATKPMGKIIKVTYRENTVKFPLPLRSGITYLWGEVTRRFSKVNQKAFRIMYIDHNGNSVQIISDDSLRDCIDDSSLNGMMTIRMFIERGT